MKNKFDLIARQDQVEAKLFDLLKKTEFKYDEEVAAATALLRSQGLQVAAALLNYGRMKVDQLRLGEMNEQS